LAWKSAASCSTLFAIVKQIHLTGVALNSFFDNASFLTFIFGQGLTSPDSGVLSILAFTSIIVVVASPGPLAGMLKRYSLKLTSLHMYILFQTGHYNRKPFECLLAPM
jgi:hypothetical protein